MILKPISPCGCIDHDVHYTHLVYCRSRRATWVHLTDLDLESGNGAMASWSLYDSEHDGRMIGWTAHRIGLWMRSNRGPDPAVSQLEQPPLKLRWVPLELDPDEIIEQREMEGQSKLF